MSKLSAFEKDIKQLSKTLYKMSHVEGPRAVSSALNKTAAKIRTVVVRDVSKETQVPQKIIRKKAYFRRSTARKQKASISLYRSGVPLISIAGGKNAIQEPAPGWISVKKFFVERGFVNKVRGRNQVLQRKGRARRPIDVVKINIYPAVDKAMPRRTNQMMSTEFPRLLRRELEYRISKYV